jgi:hypothetical protein
MPKRKSNARCCLCGLTYEGIGNNPAPLAMSGRCCDHCDEIVIKARIDPARLAMEIERVQYAIMHKLGDPRAMAIAAICASRGPGLLVEKRLQLAQIRDEL